MSDDKITKLPTKFKRPPTNDDRMLSVVVDPEPCREHAYIIDPESDTVSCKRCSKTFNPMSVLVDLCGKESTWMSNHKRYEKEMLRLNERQRTKRRHCGKMTLISYR